MTATTSMALDYVFSNIHQLRIEAVPDGKTTDYFVVCSCGYETGQFTSHASASMRLTYPCEIEAIRKASEKRRANRLRQMKENAA